MSQPELVFVSTGPDGMAELVVNFGVYSGRQATPAEVERLARQLLENVTAVEIVCEQRYEFTPDAEATVYRVRVTAPGAGHRVAELRDTVAAWAEDCIDERYVAP
jgi:lipase chaperone LimK